MVAMVTYWSCDSIIIKINSTPTFPPEQHEIFLCGLDKRVIALPPLTSHAIKFRHACPGRHDAEDDIKQTGDNYVYHHLRLSVGVGPGVMTQSDHCVN
jgi:hypothetical protein